MNSKSLLDKVDELYEDYLTFWADVCNIESQTCDKAGVDAVGSYFAHAAKKRGWDVDIFEQSEAGDVVVITMNPDAPNAPISISGHIDTVHPKGLFPTPAVSFDDDKIYGPGVTDCKGGAVACFLAMDALRECGFTTRPVKLFLQSDEEVGSVYSNKATINYICDKAKDSVAFLNTESAKGADTVMTSCKGILRYNFTVHGVAMHSSSCTDAANAVAEAAYKIIELEKMKDKDAITCNCGVIKGGTVANAVADYCSFTADVRFTCDEEEAAARRKLQEVAAHTTVAGCSCELIEINTRPAMPRTGKNLALLDTVNGINAKVGLPHLEEMRFLGGTDAAYVTKAGIPCIDGLGVEGGLIHSRDEFAYKRSLAHAAKQIAAIVAYI